MKILRGQASHFFYKLFILSLILFAGLTELQAQQLTIPRIEAMPNLPQPYVMRDWKQVAIGYDALVYDLDLTGEYRPHTALYSGTVNYPDQGSFHQQTYVGQTLTHNEAINSMMGVVGASLCGIDKTSADGHNWVLMLAEFYNRANGQDLYLNNAGAKTGNDWWYETIPNILFYQLYSLYPDEGHFEEQFLVVADRWLEAVYQMGGETAPWNPPYMYFRSFNFEDMEPVATGVPEPEAAGALAWIFYHAYTQSGQDKYRIGAELCMEYFTGLDENPVYELQYLYGLVAAARMNGELGTDYDLEKIMNWSFDVGPLRQWAHTTGWGVTVGNWNGLDVSGLTGAISVPDNTDFGDYAFLMNSFQQAGILTPLARYDDRYARALGKYLLNMANSSRLFYSAYLPEENQDGSAWAKTNDPDSYIAYEAIRRYQDDNSPFATGDALKGGWAPTNLSLYSSSPVGYLGAILDTTDVEGILKFDLLVTDFFHDDAYPSYLVYNPHNEGKTITMDLGSSPVDLYNAVSNQLEATSVSGSTAMSLGADIAAIWVLLPAGSTITREGNLTLCNSRVIDYVPANPVPGPLRLKALAAEDSVITTVTSGVNIHCTASSPETENITYTWLENEEIIGSGEAIYTWTSPHTIGSYQIHCRISDGTGAVLEDSVKIRVVEYINDAPVILGISSIEARVGLAGQTELSCRASDANGEALTYSWDSEYGSLSQEADSTATWTAPGTAGEYTVYCRVEDAHQGSASDSIILRVWDASGYVPGTLIAHYPFNYNVDDYSGYDNHGTKKDITYINIRDAAYKFNGLSSIVEVPSSDILNTNDAITITFWMMPTRLYTRETYPISHGLWHERWKISVTDNKIRWTVRTVDDGQVSISDLDSETGIELDRLYQVTATYDGQYTDLFIDSEFEGYMKQSGIIENSLIPMTIGQASPTATGNNFKGVLDEFRIYDYALSHEDIREAYQEDLLVMTERLEEPALHVELYPNPFNENLNIIYHLDSPVRVQVDIHDILSRKIRSFTPGIQGPGRHVLSWDGTNENGQEVLKGIFFCKVMAGDQVFTTKILRN